MPCKHHVRIFVGCHSATEISKISINLSSPAGERTVCSTMLPSKSSIILQLLMMDQFTRMFVLLLALLVTTAQFQECPLKFSSVRYTKHESCKLAQDSGLEESECCKHALGYISRVTALHTNETNGASLFLDEATSFSCWNATHELNLGINYEFCNFAPPRYTAYKSPCSFGTMNELLYNLTTFDDTLGICKQQISEPTSCLRSFSSGALHLARSLNDSIDTCATSLLVGLISTDIRNSVWVDPLTEQSLHGIVARPSHDKRESIMETSLIFVCSFIAVGIALVSLSFFCRMHALKQDKHKVGSTNFEEDTDQDQSKVVHNDGLYEFSRKEIWKATRNFSSENFIGSGSAGLVHKGVLPSGQLVAIKHIDKEKKAETFFQEVESLSKVRHPNLVSLLGYCQSFEDYYLVYEFCANGSLWQWLFGDRRPLTWEERLRVAIGSARGLLFLHTNVGGAIIHRDVKPTNILINDNMDPKLSDFGLSKFLSMEESHVFTEVKGTSGYLDPEYMSRGQLTLASDVYSFGIVLLQLVSGRKPIDFDLQHRYSLIRSAKKVAEGVSNVNKFADPRMEGSFSVVAVKTVVEIAVLSTSQSSYDRPSIREINEALDVAWKASSDLISPGSSTRLSVSRSSQSSSQRPGTQESGSKVSPASTSGVLPQESQSHASSSGSTLPLPPNRRVLPR